LRGERYENTLAILSNNCGPRQRDPISFVLHVFLTQPVQCAIGPCGIHFIEAHPELLLPTRELDTAQAAFVRELQLGEGRARAERHALMGGGELFVHFGSGRLVDQIDTLTAMCRAALRNTEYGEQQRLGACNIIVQRAAARTTLSNRTLVEVNSRVQAVLERMGGTKQDLASAW
jgi:hypothetical protein